MLLAPLIQAQTNWYIPAVVDLQVCCFGRTLVGFHSIYFDCCLDLWTHGATSSNSSNGAPVPSRSAKPYLPQEAMNQLVGTQARLPASLAQKFKAGWFICDSPPTKYWCRDPRKHGCMILYTYVFSIGFVRFRSFLFQNFSAKGHVSAHVFDLCISQKSCRLHVVGVLAYIILAYIVCDQGRGGLTCLMSNVIKPVFGKKMILYCNKHPTNIPTTLPVKSHFLSFVFFSKFVNYN